MKFKVVGLTLAVIALGALAAILAFKKQSASQGWQYP